MISKSSVISAVKEVDLFYAGYSLVLGVVQSCSVDNGDNNGVPTVNK